MPTTVELGRKIRAKYPGQYDDLDDATIGARAKAKYPEYADYTDAPFQAQAPAGAGAAAVAPTAGLANALPGALGMIGGLTPGGMLRNMAVSGGAQAAGEMGRQAATGPPGIEDWGGVGRQGLVGAGSALTGGLAGKAINAVARTGMAIGGRVNPQIARTLTKYGVNVGEGMFGAKKLAKVQQRAADSAENLYKAADSNTGTNIPVKPMADAVRRLATKPGTSRTRKRMFARAADKIEKDYASHVSPSELRGLKQEFQGIVNYDAKNKTVGPVKLAVAKTMAGQARGNLIHLPQFGKQIEKADAELGRLRDAEQALRKSAKRVPGGNIGSLSYLTGILDHPTAYSTLALMLNSLGKPANLATRALGSAAFPPGIMDEEE